MADNDVTALLRAGRNGDDEAMNTLMPLVYDELTRIARGAMRAERKDHTLQTKALVHEAYLRLVTADVEWQDRAHFLAVAARTMRRVLINHAKSRGRVKRGGMKAVRIDLTEVAGTELPASVDVLDLNDALDRLAAEDAQTAQLVEMHFYAGMNYEELAETLNLSQATIGRNLRFAKAWLRRELESPRA